MVDFGFVLTNDTPHSLDAGGFSALRDIGLTHCRYSVDWSVMEPTQGEYVWDRHWATVTVNTDHHFDLLTKYGFNVTMNLDWAPAWASEGKPTYQRYETGCWVLTNPGIHYRGDGNFADQREDCNINPPHINPEEVRAFAREMAIRYGDKVATWTAWNEPGSVGYWPPSKCTPHIPPDEAVERLMNEVVIPFTDGVRSVFPNAEFSGIEADTWDILGRVLKAEKDRGLHLFDRITLHPYAWGPFPEHSYERITTEFIPTILPFHNGRPVDCSEIDDDGTGKMSEWLVHILGQQWFDRITFLDVRTWFVDWDTGNYTLTAIGKKMKQLMRPSRHRAARIK